MPTPPELLKMKTLAQWLQERYPKILEEYYNSFSNKRIDIWLAEYNDKILAEYVRSENG